MFGYGRWEKIRKMSQGQSGSLVEKSDIDLRLLANSFLTTIEKHIPFDKLELKKFILNMIVTRPEDIQLEESNEYLDHSVLSRATSSGSRL